MKLYKVRKYIIRIGDTVLKITLHGKIAST